MFYYRAFGLNISSEVELPGMIEIDSDNKFHVQISLNEVNVPPFKGIDSPNYFVDGENVYLWWDEIGKVKISDGKQIIVDSSSNLNSNETSIIPFLLGPVMSILLYQRGLLVLHGSSINVNNGAIAFLGYRGLGKSTTAINLYKKGYPLITDDILAVEFNKEGLPVVYPGYPHARLSDDSYMHINTDILTPIRTYAGKVFCDASRGFLPEPVELKKIYILEEGEKLRISNFKSQESVINLIRHSTANRVMQDNKDQAKNLIQCANLIKNITISRLEISHSFKNLPDLVNLIEDDFNVGG